MPCPCLLDLNEASACRHTGSMLSDAVTLRQVHRGEFQGSLCIDGSCGLNPIDRSAGLRSDSALIQYVFLLKLGLSADTADGED